MTYVYWRQVAREQNASELENMRHAAEDEMRGRDWLPARTGAFPYDGPGSAYPYDNDHGGVEDYAAAWESKGAFVTYLGERQNTLVRPAPPVDGRESALYSELCEINMSLAGIEASRQHAATLAAVRDDFGPIPTAIWNG